MFVNYTQVSQDQLFVISEETVAIPNGTHEIYIVEDDPSIFLSSALLQVLHLLFHVPQGVAVTYTIVKCFGS